MVRTLGCRPAQVPAGWRARAGDHSRDHRHRLTSQLKHSQVDSPAVHSAVFSWDHAYLRDHPALCRRLPGYATRTAADAPGVLAVLDARRSPASAAGGWSWGRQPCCAAVTTGAAQPRCSAVRADRSAPADLRSSARSSCAR